MRPLLIGLALSTASSLVFAACSPDPGSATATTGGTGGAPSCEGVYFVEGDTDGGEPCDICLHDHCCPEAAECRDQGCIDCVNTLLPNCGPKPRAVSKCLYAYCQPICSPGWAPTSTTTGG